MTRGQQIINKIIAGLQAALPGDSKVTVNSDRRRDVTPTEMPMISVITDHENVVPLLQSKRTSPLVTRTMLIPVLIRAVESDQDNLRAFVVRTVMQDNDLRLSLSGLYETATIWHVNPTGGRGVIGSTPPLVEIQFTAEYLTFAIDAEKGTDNQMAETA